MSAGGGHGVASTATLESLAMQAEAMHLAAEWLVTFPFELPPAGDVEVTSSGEVSLHVLPATGRPEPVAVLRALAGQLSSARLEVDRPRMQRAGRWGRMVRLRVPVPGVDITLWCVETVPLPPLRAMPR